jgi:hypothetical protein
MIRPSPSRTGDDPACRVAHYDDVIGEFNQAGLESHALFMALPVKCELRLIGKRRRSIHTFPYDLAFERSLHPKAKTSEERVVHE